MTYYLIDTENVKYEWTSLISPKTGDNVLFFYSQNSVSILKDRVKEFAEKLKGNCISLNKKIQKFSELPYLIHNNKVSFDTIKCNVGKNALDFQLVSYLGMIICEDPDSEFVIVSNDTGYNSVVTMWANKGIKIKQKCKQTKKETKIKVVANTTIKPKKKKKKKKTPSKMAS